MTGWFGEWKAAGFVCVACALLCARCSDAAVYPLAKVTLKVVDESGKPIEGADAGVNFWRPLPAGKGWGGQSLNKSGLTNRKGLWTTVGWGGPSISYGARKQGYYPTGLDYEYKKLGLGMWRPWNPTLTVVLRKKRNPVAMYMKDVDIEMPKLGAPVGYDLVVGDLVAPYGRGRTSDFVFTMTRRFRSRKDFRISMTLTFSHPGDGIQELPADPVPGSRFRYHYQAPATGYQRRWTRVIGHRPGGSFYGPMEPSKDKYWVFRIRSELDGQGRVTRALYGLIPRGVFPYGYVEPNAGVTFRYYLNPTGTRSLEWNGKNLFEKRR